MVTTDDCRQAIVDSILQNKQLWLNYFNVTSTADFPKDFTGKNLILTPSCWTRTSKRKVGNKIHREFENIHCCYGVTWLVVETANGIFVDMKPPHMVWQE